MTTIAQARNSKHPPLSTHRTAVESSDSCGMNRETATQLTSDERTQARRTFQMEDMITVIVSEVPSRGSPSNLHLSPSNRPVVQEADRRGQMSPNVVAATDDTSAAKDIAENLNKRRRTRRGCLTCRRRKKKCDEEKPACQNCCKLRLACQWSVMSRSIHSIQPFSRGVPGSSARCFDSDEPVTPENSRDRGDQRSSLVPIAHQPAPFDLAMKPHDPIDSVQGVHASDNAKSNVPQSPRTNAIAGAASSYIDSPLSTHDSPQIPGHEAPELPQSRLPQRAAIGESVPQVSQSQPAPSRCVDHVSQVWAPPRDQPILPPHIMQVEHLLSQSPQNCPVPGSGNNQTLNIPPQSQDFLSRSDRPAPQSRIVLEPQSMRMALAQPIHVNTPQSAHQQTWPYRQMHVTREHSNGLYGSATFSSAKTFALEDVARSQMLRNAPYHHLDPTLVRDRQRCQKALERFKNACGLDSGLDVQAIRNLLLQVFDPQRDTNYHCSSKLSKRGELSEHVNVERDFLCTYGYNITFCEGVYVDSQVFIDDAARVHIGPNTWLGHGVRILTSVPFLEPDRRPSEKRVSRAVRIEADVVIGQEVVIYPGVTVARGSIVEPGSVVRHDYSSTVEAD